jgi:hypothetical protein
LSPKDQRPEIDGHALHNRETPMIAIPNYARNNRGGRSIVRIRDR